MLDRASASNAELVGQGDNSILKILAPELKNVPSLSWLFPEGKVTKVLDDSFKVVLEMPKN